MSDRSPVWQAEYEVGPEAAARLIGARWPQLRPVRIESVGFGFDNTVYRVNGRYVFRFPRRTMGAELIEIERCILPALNERPLPLSVPNPVWIGEPGEGYPWRYLGYPFLEGQSPAPTSPAARARNAGLLAAFLRELHRFPAERAERLGVPRDRLGRLDFRQRYDLFVNNIDQVTAAGWRQDRQALLRVAEEARAEDAPAGGRIWLVHGDLHLRNLLEGPDGRLAAVIDWGDVHLGDRAVDLAVAYGYLPPEGRAEFFRIYGAVDETTKRLARARAVFTLLYLLLFARDREDRRLQQTASQCLAYALAGDDGAQ